MGIHTLLRHGPLERLCKGVLPKYSLTNKKSRLYFMAKEVTEESIHDFSIEGLAGKMQAPRTCWGTSNNILAFI